ncbi:hypothetical protein [Paenisporosarcina sp. NPDC076898]|uniref:hypothetical protein n=1 Tax=unclassified Paenisporosarcina TaxID=2642018 RepID=UPI003D03E177
MTIGKRKIIVSSLISLLLLLSLFVSVASAESSKFDCSFAGFQCKGVNVFSYGTHFNHSDYVYATRGQVLAVSNQSDGPFNLVTQLVDLFGTPISSEIAFTDTQFIAVPREGSYRVKVTCMDSSASKRCLGRGSVSQ